MRFRISLLRFNIKKDAERIGGTYFVFIIFYYTIVTFDTGVCLYVFLVPQIIFSVSKASRACQKHPFGSFCFLLCLCVMANVPPWRYDYDSFSGGQHFSGYYL